MVNGTLAITVVSFSNVITIIITIVIVIVSTIITQKYYVYL